VVNHTLRNRAPRAETLGYRYEGRLRGLIQPAKAGFVILAEGFSPAENETPM
jgi:hypothetical protein